MATGRTMGPRTMAAPRARPRTARPTATARRTAADHDRRCELTLAAMALAGLPVGGFAYSHGLEAAVAGGAVPDAAALRDWLADVLRTARAGSDAILLAAAHARRPSAGRGCRRWPARSPPRAERRLRDDGRRARPSPGPSPRVWRHRPCPPLRLSRGRRRAPRAELDLPPSPPPRLYLQAFAGNLVSAAIRLVPLGQTEGQRLWPGSRRCRAAWRPRRAEAAARRHRRRRRSCCRHRRDAARNAATSRMFRT